MLCCMPVLPPRHPDRLGTDSFLDEMKAGLEGAFVLGCFNRYITVYSQQVRAINLVVALMEKHGTMADMRVAIVGAGFAGVTAAAHMLEKTNAEVAVFEAAPRPLWLQDDCRERWLHPGLYDWPLPGSLEPRTYLPVMNWRAGRTRDVVAQVREQWDDVRNRKPNLTCYFDTVVSAVERAAKGRLRLILQPAGDAGEYDIVIVAVGFGVENGGLARPSYWNDVDGLVRAHGNVLVAGFGDGALADLLRLCLPDYRQDRLIELVREVPEVDCAAIVEKERALSANQAELNAFYEQLEVPTVVAKMKMKPVNGPSVMIAGQGPLYGTTSAILNRFLVSQLRKARPGAFSVLSMGVDDVQRAEVGIRVIFRDKSERTFDHVMLRYGPKAALDSIAGLFDPQVVIERRRHWRGMPQALDRTRVPLFEQTERVDDLPPGLQALPSYESGGDPWCLVIAPGTSSIWPDLAVNALNQVKHPPHKEAEPIQLPTLPLFVRAEEAVSGVAYLRAAVRALCSADVLIADVTGFDDPAVMFLLGIRAAVRRGVTITCINERVTGDYWSKVPFNIREVNLLSVAEPEERVKDLANAIRDGLGQSQLQPAYLDLPVYDYVRQGPVHAPLGKTPVLYLRSFSPEYKCGRLEGVKQNLETAFSSFFPDSRLYSIIDEASPRLAGHRLYAAIRHRELCVIDWSEWKANVFFELGTRLASHPTVPLSILDERPSEATGARPKLVELLSPAIYERATDLPRFINLVENYIEERGTITNHVFAVARQFFETNQERYRTGIDESLSEEANATVSRGDPLQTIEVSVLYAAENSDFTRQVSRSSSEQLCAAWCYLDEREAPHTWRPSALLDSTSLECFNRYRNLGLRLRSALGLRQSERDRRLLARLRERQRQIRKLAALAGQLNQWHTLRPKIDNGQLDHNDLESAMADLQVLSGQVEGMAGPAAVIVQQALDHDFHALKRALEAGVTK
jgi:hypothetical protein